MKRLPWFVLVGAALLVTACQKNNDSDSDEAAPPQVVVMNESSQALLDLQGLWRIENPTVPSSSNLPIAYALQIDGGGSLSLLHYNRQGQTTTAHRLGTLNVLQRQAGEVEIDETAFLAWQALSLAETCGPRNTQCIRDEQFRVREVLEFDVPAWILRDGSLTFTGVLSGLKVRKASPGHIEKVRRSLEKDTQQTRAVVNRMVRLAPQGAQPLKRIVVQTGSQSFQHLIGSRQTYSCNGREVVIPEDVRAVTLSAGPQITLNDKTTAPLAFPIVASSTTPISFSFWNPLRCGDRACNRVNVTFNDYEIALSETLEGCANVTFTYGN